MEIDYRPHFNSEFELLIERIHPPRVCIDNDTCQDCTLVKVDSANKHGILLDMVQVLTDLDLVISKSYICSDGGWFMDVFHVTDQLGNKITDESLIHYIQQALCASRRGKKELQTCLGREMSTRHVSTEDTALEMTGTDRPGLLSEISAVLAELGCHVTAAEAWTHNTRAACIIYVEDETTGRSITDSARLAHIQELLENVVDAHQQMGERKSVRLTPPAASRTHTERRLHQLMLADRDYEKCSSCGDGGGYGGGGSGVVYRNEKGHGKGCDGTIVTIENCEEKGYSVVNMRSRDRPKLLFDTVCTLTDMQYVVFHAAISSMGSIAVQEYYIRHKNGCTLDLETERRRVIQCLTAAIERRVSHGLKLDVSTRDRLGLLSDITRVFRENGLTVTRADIGTRGERAVGSFYVTDVSGNNVNPDMVIEVIRQEIGGTVLVVNKSSGWSPENSTSSTTRSKGNGVEDRPRFSLGSLLWSRLEQLSSNFGVIKL
ncbi:ACT domain-containing protein ACR1-like [Cornus florida]|uniref:ACT domain-containing protein ACR1-like n=1 Tax=Cornus florida TaxID=4283 RepID=UPI00289C1109|nr:ACT domain-containing protein ACR1-like [Cornus florida]